MAWLRIDADYPVDGSVRSTGYAWAWAVILAAFKRSKAFGRLTDADLCDRALYDVAQVPGCPAGRTWTVRDAFVDAGLLTSCDDGTWTTPSWERYQEDPTKSERQAAYREANAERRAAAEKKRRESKRVATRGDGVATRGDGERRVATPDVDVDVDKQQQPPVANATVPPSQGGHPVEPASEVESAPEVEAPKLTARQRQALELHAEWVSVHRVEGPAASLTTKVGKKRLAVLAARLAEGYTPEQVATVIRASAASEWHVRTGNTGVEFTCRDDQFPKLLRAGGPARASPPAVASVNAAWTPNPDPRPLRPGEELLSFDDLEAP